MKFNKKITVTALSTVLGLGLVGSISGAVAWYQYSTRATSSVVGTSVGNGGTLQVSVDGGTTWARDLRSTDIFANAKDNETPFDGNFKPVTFGGVNGGTINEGNIVAGENLDTSKAYLNPEYGQEAMSTWRQATKNKDYLQYTVEFQAQELNNTTHQYEKVAYPVYLTDIVLNGLGVDSTDARTNEDITAAIRVHIHVAGGKDYLLAPQSGELTNASLDTYGKLDLDGNGQADHVGGYEWDVTDREAIYGDGSFEDTDSDPETPDVYVGKQQSFLYPKALLAARETEGANIGKIKSTDATKALGTTTTSGDNLIITFTIWNEGWAQLDPYTSPDDANVKSMWDPATRDGVKFHVGFTFDIGDVFQA